MGIVINIFLLIATIFAIATLCYVAVDIILEALRGEKEEEPAEQPQEVKAEPVVVAPVPPPVAEDFTEVMPEIVEHIEPEQADEMISDELAMEIAHTEHGAGHGKQGIANIGDIDKLFGENEVVTLAALKEKGLVKKKFGRVKILADGALNKPLTVKAESYSVQAIKMIELTGGTVIILKD